jgi:hypothetical protein
MPADGAPAGQLDVAADAQEERQAQDLLEAAAADAHRLQEQQQQQGEDDPEEWEDEPDVPEPQVREDMADAQQAPNPQQAAAAGRLARFAKDLKLLTGPDAMHTLAGVVRVSPCAAAAHTAF